MGVNKINLPIILGLNKIDFHVDFQFEASLTINWTATDLKV